MEKETQAARNVLMIQPVRFGFNQETAIDNDFQHPSNLSPEEIQLKARDEFNRYVLILASKGVHVVTFEDTYVPYTPDSIFVNNWVSFHADGTVILYPMEAEDRRPERRPDILEKLESTYHFKINRTIDITREEESGRYLESTGSMVFDYVNKVIYACLSPRTHKELLYVIAKKIGYDKICTFESADEKGEEIYHTNVMMCVGEKFAMIWADSIKNPKDKDAVIKSLTETGHEIIYLNADQINHFAGNALEVANVKDERFLIISQEGADSLKEDQKKVLQKYVEIVPIPLDVIEQCNGGSARCMLADIRLPKNEDYFHQ